MTKFKLVTKVSLLGFASAAADVIQSDRAGPEKDESEGERSQRQWEFIAAVAYKSIVEVHLGDGCGQIDADGEGGYAREQTEHDEDPSEELGEGREITGPGRESETVDELSVVLQSSENLVVAMAEHYRAEG
jgi:hypothetical protein